MKLHERSRESKGKDAVAELCAGMTSAPL